MRLILKIAMFHELSSGTRQGLYPLAQQFKASDNRAALLHCLQHMFSVGPKLQIATPKQITTTLEAFYIYIVTLQAAGNSPDPCRNPDIQKLFALTPSGSDTSVVQSGTFLHNEVDRRGISSIERDDEGITISHSQLTSVIKSSIMRLLVQKIREENNACSNAQVFNPCAAYILSRGRCNRQGCPQEHIESFNADAYNERILLLFLQFKIVQIMLPYVSSKENFDIQKCVHIALCIFVKPNISIQILGLKNVLTSVPRSSRDGNNGNLSPSPNSGFSKKCQACS